MSTASALEREMACPASPVLPHVHEGGEDADRGDSIHVFCRSIIAGTPRAVALAAVPNDDWRKTCERIDFGVLCAGVLDVRAEAAYRLDLDTDAVTFLGLNIGRNYPPRSDNHIDGTNDFEGRRFDGLRVVCDIKTGREVTACRDNPQMRFHARVQMLLHDADKVEARLCYVREDGSVYIDSHTFTRFELDVFGDQLVEMREAIADARRVFEETGSVTVHSGDHCRYCPALQACPRYTALARSMVTDLTALAGDGSGLEFAGATAEERRQARIEALRSRFALLGQEKQGSAWMLTTDAERLVEDVKEALKAIARQTAIPLPNGKIVKETRSTSRRLVQGRALALLVQKGASEAEIAALYDEEPTFPVKAVNGPDSKKTKPRIRKERAA